MPTTNPSEYAAGRAQLVVQPDASGRDFRDSTHLLSCKLTGGLKADVTLAKVNHFASPALTSAQIFSFFRWIPLCLGDDHHMRCKTLN